MTRHGLTKVAVTKGLAQKGMNDRSPEQCYVWLDDNDDHRPIRIEGWHGYSITQVLRLTKQQASVLGYALHMAVNQAREREAAE